uniref:SGNH domain-containing protein n=1 Tax=Angiostrongylus cantonensis TaxID=6313 RepID=A0A158PCE8_ANGCA
MRVEISKLEEAYRHVVGSQWCELLRTIRGYAPSVLSISFTFASDMQLVNDFYTGAQQVALNNDLFATNFRPDIPVIPLNVEKAVSRIISDIKTLAAGGLSYPVCGFCIRIGMIFFRMCGDCYWQKQALSNVEQAAPRCEAVLKSSKCKADGSAVLAFPYDSKFVKILLKDVHIMTIGDSIMRGIYKDLIAMLHGDELVKDIHLKTKTESSFFGDRQVDLSFFAQERAFLEMCSTGEFPDVLLINSCLWDITRASMMIRRLRLMMPATTQVIWLNMPWPIPVDTPSLVNRADNINTRHLSRMLVVDANFRASQLFRAAGYDVLDLAFYMRNQALYSYRSAEEACSSDMWKNWATRSLVESDISTLPENRSALGSFPEIIQAQAFPKVAEYTKNGLNQEVTLLVDEDPIAVMKGRECPHGTVG